MVCLLSSAIRFLLSTHEYARTVTPILLPLNAVLIVEPLYTIYRGVAAAFPTSRVFRYSQTVLAAVRGSELLLDSRPLALRFQHFYCSEVVIRPSVEHLTQGLWVGGGRG